MTVVSLLVARPVPVAFRQFVSPVAVARAQQTACRQQTENEGKRRQTDLSARKTGAWLPLF